LASTTSPYFILLLVLIVAVVCLWAGRAPRVARIFLTVAAGLLLLLGWGPFADGMLRPLEPRHPSLMEASALPDSAWVVLAGGAASRSGIPPVAWLTEASLARLAA
jgi:uncharacterized SAM-binding protein YcdF (DUF218 family)